MQTDNKSAGDNPAAAAVHDSVYDGLLGSDASAWAFGTDFDDPLAGIDTSIAADVNHEALAAYALMLGDDALIMSHRLTQWCSRAPDLEDDVALSNIALDLLGQARLLLARAAAADPQIVPDMPADSPVPADDALAFFRDEPQFRNVRLVEADNGDFAVTITRLLVFTAWRLEIFSALTRSRDTVLAAVAAKGVKEMTYHRDYAARWFVTLAQGTDESGRRIEAALHTVWPYVGELFETVGAEQAAVADGVGIDPTTMRPAFDGLLDTIFSAAGIDVPATSQMGGVNGRAGRDGLHTEAMGPLLAQMQSVARAHPMGRW